MNSGQAILKDAYQKRRAKNENFSLRAFARWLNVSPAQLSQLIFGKLPLTMKIIKKMLPKLALSRLSHAKSDPRWIAQQLGIGLSGAHLAVQRLERLGILQTKPRLKQICDPIEVVSELPSEAIRKYHKQNLALAEGKLESFSVQMREYQSISIVLNPDQLNVQLFPISKSN